jgi:ribosomal protein S18 acetylase RimI-like enzyme
MNEIPINVRIAWAEDDREAAQIASQAFASLRQIYIPAPASQQSARQLRSQTTLIVAECKGQLLGTVRCYVKDDALQIMALAVRPEFRRRGVARALVDHCTKLAREQGLRQLRTYTIKETGNVPIFERMGFNVISEAIDSTATSPSGGEVTEVTFQRSLE